MSAYVLLGDPAWIEASIMSYYPYVTKIIATYDCRGRSFTGLQLDVDDCIKRIKAIDYESKVMFIAGNFSSEEFHDNPMMGENQQRKVGLEVASQYGDWVLQLDTDEIVSNWDRFAIALDYASSENFDSLYHPSIYIYQLITSKYALESCRRWWGRQAGFQDHCAYVLVLTYIGLAALLVNHCT